MKKTLLITLTLLLFFSTHAQEGRKVIRGFNFQAENDVFAGLVGLKNLDKDYSGGFRFEFYTDYLRQGIFPLFRNRKDDPNNQKPMEHNTNSLYLHGMGFTPTRDSFVLTTVVPSQRPFASLLGVGWKRVAMFEEGPILKLLHIKRQSAIVSDIFIGKVGTKAPGNVQNFLHRYVTNSKQVMGWPNQIGNGGKWVFNYRITSHINLTDTDTANKRKNNIFLSPQISVGNLFFNAGLKLSFSNQQTGTMGMISSMPSNELKENFDVDLRKFKNRIKYEVYVKTMVVGRNTLLQGMPFYDNSVYTIKKEDMNRFVHDFGLKILFLYHPDQHKIRDNIAFFELIYRTKEFSYGFNHAFGNVGFAFMIR